MSVSTAQLRANKNLDPGWWRSQTGPAQVLIIAVLVLVLAVAFWVVFGWDSGPARPVPSVVGQGEAIAVKQLRAAGFDRIDTHDALGRDRSGKAQQWQVCFQSPGAGPSRRPSNRISLGLARTSENCPGPEIGDQGIERTIHLNDALPDFTQPTNWSAYIVRQDLGDDASIRFLERGDPNRPITDDLGDWLICRQTPPAHEPWHGRPLTFTVARYDDGC